MGVRHYSRLAVNYLNGKREPRRGLKEHCLAAHEGAIIDFFMLI